jgi:small-conductance mechanosensitive channel
LPVERWPWEAEIETLAIWQNMMMYFEQFERLLLDEILVFANLIQIPAVILTGAVAWLVCRPIRLWAVAWIERVPEHHHLDWIVHHRSWVTDRLVPLITPAAWAIGLWISVVVAERARWPNLVTQTAVSLLVAWLVIRLAAALVPYTALARLIAVLAWLVAALNIVHLPGPTLDVLDSAAIVVGGLRVSILTIVRGVLSLTVLLWAATVASNLFERRITRFSEITPRARVLLGKLLKATLMTLAVVLSLTSIGVGFTTLALFTGALGVGVGLGLQSVSACRGPSPTCSAGLFCFWTSRSSRAM